jgi:hypothetical protein
LYTGVFCTVISAGGDNVAVESATDLVAIFHDASACANLHSAVFQNFDFVNDDFFGKSHFNFS